MVADDDAVGVHDVARALGQAPGGEAAGPASGDEADVGGVGLVGHRQPEAGGQGAHLVLGGEFAEREHESGEALLVEDGEHVGLVLAPVRRAAQLGRALLRPGDPRVVSRCDGVESLGAAHGQQPGELHAAVAAQAGVGRAPLRVGVDEVVDDALGEGPAQVPDDQVDAEALGDPPGVVGLGHRRRPHEQVDADDLVALRLDEGGGDRRVDAAGHGHRNAHLGNSWNWSGSVRGALNGAGGHTRNPGIRAYRSPPPTRLSRCAWAARAQHMEPRAASSKEPPAGKSSDDDPLARAQRTRPRRGAHR